MLASDVDVVVELIGGMEPAGEWIGKALQAGKSVVTANKLLISERGAELADLARKMGGGSNTAPRSPAASPQLSGFRKGWRVTIFTGSREF